MVLPTETETWALLYRFDQVLCADPCNPKRNAVLAGQFGLTDGNPNPVRWFASVAVLANGPLTCRPNDTAGVGYYHMGISDEPIPRLFGLEDEDGVELFYNIAVTPWFHVTPDVQVIDPSNFRNDTAVVVGLRATVSF